MGLHGPGWLYVLGITPRGDLPLWTPRARATDLGQGPNLRHGDRAGSLRATDPRAREKTRGQKMKKCRCAKKTRLYIVIQGSSSGRVRREIPGVTQVDQKGHERKTAVVTAYLCWRKHGIYLSWGINSDKTREQLFREQPKIKIVLVRNTRNRKRRPLRLLWILVLRNMITVLCG